MRRTAFICLLALVCPGGVWAQTGAGSGAVTGTIQELAGDGIPDTTVVLTNTALGLRRVMETSDDGVFDAPALVPAAGYRLKVSRKGFVDWDSGEFSVSVGQTVDFKVTLKHAEQAEGEENGVPAPKVEERRNGLTTLVTPRELETLPSAERRLDPLVQLSPLAGIDHRTGRLTLAGLPVSNLFLTDGVATTNTFYGSQPAIANQLPEESVQEFQVLGATYSAGYGPAMGGVVNAATRTGSNQFHGSGYDYYRNSGLSAIGRYTLGNKLLDHQNQAGGSLGGPIRNDRLFFFANVERLDAQGNGLNRILDPVLTNPGGTAVPAANCKATAAQCAAAIAYIQGQMNVLVPETDTWSTGLARVDYRRSERNSFTFTADALNAHSPGGGPVGQVSPSGGLLGLNNTTDQTRYAKAAWTAAPSPKTLNEMRLGFYQDRIFNPAYDLGSAPGNTAITVDGATVGSPQPNASSLTEQRYQLTENLTATSNTHSLNLGADLWRTRDTIDSLASAGQYAYDSLTAFAQDFATGGTHYSYFDQQLGTALRRLPYKRYNLYAVDTWRPFSQLTIVAGVRFEKPLMPQPPQANPNYYQTGTITSPNIDFAPRISIAYSSSEKTTLRVGYGWFYEPMPGALFDSLYYTGNAVNLSDVTAVAGQPNAPAFPHTFASTSAIPAGMTNLMYAVSKLRDPVVRETTAAVEHQFDANTTLTVTALHDRGYKLWSVSDQNIAAPTVHKFYSMENVAGAQTGTYYTDMYTAKLDPRYAHVWQVQNGGSWWYNAAVVELRRRMSHGISVLASYTLSHAIGDTSGPLLDGVLPLNTYNGNVGGDRGPAATDQRHRGMVNWTWQPQQHWLRGWSLSGITTMASGQPETPLVLVAGQQFSGTSMLYPSTLNGWGGWARAPFAGIGSLTTGPQYNVDARISRTINIRERVRVTLLFEAFNAFNTQFDTAVSTAAYTATPTTPPSGAVNGPYTGVIKPVAGAGAGIAGGPARAAQIGLRVTF